MDIRRIAGDYADARNRVGAELAVNAVARKLCIAPVHVSRALEEWRAIVKSQRSAPPPTPRIPADRDERFAEVMAETKQRLIDEGRWPKIVVQEEK